MTTISKFEQHLVAARQPWRARSWHLACALDFIDWANDAFASSGGWKTLMAQNRYVLEACRERYLSEAIAERDLRSEERLRLNCFIRFVESSAREESAQPDAPLPAATQIIHGSVVAVSPRAAPVPACK